MEENAVDELSVSKARPRETIYYIEMKLEEANASLVRIAVK